jgi:hypothetical protein
MIEKYRKIVTSSVEINLIQDRISRILSQVADDPITDRQTIAATLLTMAPTRVYHALKRQPKGWLLSDKDGATTVWRVDWNSEYITLQSTGNCNVILEIF